jgi:chaperonin GroES
MKVIQPLRDEVVILPIEQTEQQYGNIVVPDLGKEKMTHGNVVAVGPGRLTEFGKFIGMTVKVGDEVVIPTFGAQKLFVGGEEYVVCREVEIKVIIKEQKEQDDK